MKEYVREAGVRNFEREIGTICRKAAKIYVEKKKPLTVTPKELFDYLGVPKYSNFTQEENGVGISTGLAWTSVGGETLSIEAAKFNGKGQLILTGQLGDVMKESVRAALTYARSRGYGKKVNFDKTDFHLHFPEGAVPKDGPSAGTAICTALVSLLLDKAVKTGIAMTGELTLTGRVLPVGGIKEKFLAAYRENVRTILYPKTNEKDVSEIPEQIRKELTLIPITHMDEVVKIVFGAKGGTSASAAAGKGAKAGGGRAQKGKKNAKKKSAAK
jgi:ATP-dependent Lon protease